MFRKIIPVLTIFCVLSLALASCLPLPEAPQNSPINDAVTPSIPTSPSPSFSVSPKPSITIPPDILAKLPPAVAEQIKHNGFESLPPDMQARILQLMRQSPTPQNQNSTAALPPTGDRYPDLVPLIDLGANLYQGYEGGLYKGGINTPPPEYLRIGTESAEKVRPLNGQGQTDDSGKIVLLTVGFSNTTMESLAFLSVAKTDPDKNPKVQIVDGAVGGRDAIELADSTRTRYWGELQARLDQAKVTPAQVQIVWLKEVVAGDTLPFPQDAERFRDALTAIVKTLKTKFSNLHLVYVSSRIYGGYALRNGSQEPWAYEGGFAYKWMIQEWEKGPTPGDPWVAWGPYLWANGTHSRSDGLVWNLSDFRVDDQMHPSPSGTAKVASLLSHFFKTDPTTQGWYLK